jgi:3-deoxy-7-phosphoheptulonate synthase
MLVVMEAHATAEQIEAVCAEIRAMGFTPHPMPGPTRTAIGITGNQGPIEQAGRLQRLPGVSQLIRVTVPYNSWFAHFYGGFTELTAREE